MLIDFFTRQGRRVLNIEMITPINESIIISHKVYSNPLNNQIIVNDNELI